MVRLPPMLHSHYPHFTGYQQKHSLAGLEWHWYILNYITWCGFNRTRWRVGEDACNDSFIESSSRYAFTWRVNTTPHSKVVQSQVLCTYGGGTTATNIGDNVMEFLKYSTCVRVLHFVLWNFTITFEFSILIERLSFIGKKQILLNIFTNHELHFSAFHRSISNVRAHQ